MSEWNFNLTGMPLGSMVDRTVKTKDGIKQYEEFQPDIVILASKCGKVIRSYWLPDEKRWAGFKGGEEPVAWMRWPHHPGSAAAILHDQSSEYDRCLNG
ncbi:hypothetical protein FA04_14665 [Ensifer adhaerens]|uniref:Uncharacterized protein n=1 Tax=Ensifer adhaerens TaxID=106592 RepID=A0ABY8HCL8_ENSAD|nr:hypothetical protein [Ensifer adhaerens]ANK73754.1 hypothetical protein FA04_14665 [Ensifer adhaerens]KDP70285.1 hypothetical protein FA04_29040 [Ensifer adhaerens]WFP89839.1 hypothetical protein P4B07_14895 [Ensifer adhaerens]